MEKFLDGEDEWGGNEESSFERRRKVFISIGNFFFANDGSHHVLFLSRKQIVFLRRSHSDLNAIHKLIMALVLISRHYRSFFTIVYI